MLAVGEVVYGVVGAGLGEQVECLQDGSVPSIFSILDKHLSVLSSAWR